MNGLMRRTKARKQRQKYKRKKTRSKVCEYFFEFLFKCGETTISVYLYSSVRIIPSLIHSSSHAFDISSHRLQFTRRAFPVSDVT